MDLRRTLSTILILFYSVSAFCINETGYSFTNASLQKEQLSGIKVASIYNDGAHIWFGTRTEVVRHDASEQKSWKHSIALKSSMAADANGVLWLGTPDGTFYFDSVADDFKKVSSSTLNHCTAVGNEMLVYGLNSLNIFDIGSKQLKKTVELPADYNLLDICPLSENMLILSSRDKGLQLYESNYGGLQDFTSVKVTKCRVVKVLDGKIYACSYGQGVWTFTPEGECLGKLGGIPSDYITDIALHDGRLWIGTDGAGIATIDLASGETSRMQHIPGDANSFPANAIAALYSDPKGNLWASTVRNGLFNIHKKYISTFSDSTPGSRTGLSEKCVVSFCKDDDGMLWIGTDGQGINQFDTARGEFRHYPSTYGMPVPSICRYDGNGTLLASVFNKGLYLFDTRTGNMTAFKSNGLPDNSELFDDGVFPYLYKVKEDRIFLICPKAYTLNPQTGESRLLRYEDGRAVYGLASVWHCQDFILAGFQGGAFINRYDDDIMHRLVSIGESETVTAIDCDRKNNTLWLAIDGHKLGYYHIDGDGAVTSDFYPVEDLELSNITSLTTDDKGRLWISAQGMLAVIELSTGNTRLFSVFDGFEWNDIIAGWNTELTDNTFYLGGTSGIVSINTDILDETGNKDVPSIVLNEITVSNKHIKVDGSKRNKIKVPSKHSSLILNYSVKGIQFFETPVVKYIITGSTDNVFTSSNLSLDLSSLGAGKYTIKAECRSHGLDSIDNNEVTIKIRNPWYNSALFIMLLLLLMAGASIYYTYIYARKNLTEQKEISAKDKDFLRRFCEYVSLNMDHDLSAEVLTRELGISRTLLFEKVKELTGSTVNDYIKHLRIERAQALLKDTDMSVIEISETVGFAYPRYFSSVFKEVTGYTPTAFKKMINTQ